MAKQRTTLTTRVNEIEAAVAALDEKVTQLVGIVGEQDSLLEVKADLRSAIVGKLQKDAEDALAKSPFFKQTKGVLVLAIIVGLACWIGGTIYSGIAIKSIYSKSEEVQKQFSSEVNKVTDAAHLATNEIAKHKRNVLTTLDTSSLKNLSEIKAQIAALKEADGKLKVSAVRAFVKRVTIGVFVLNVVLMILLFVLGRGRWVRG